LDAGAYTVDEAAALGYTKTLGANCSGIIGAGESKTCTITNDDIAAVPATSTISVVKTVINDNGRTKVIGDFPLFVSGTPVVSGATNLFTAGVYTITETQDTNYTRTFSGDCNTSGVLTLAPGEAKVCFVANNDIAAPSGGGGGYSAPIPPIIDVVKVPSPLALPAGPGTVNYTYTLRNVGTVAVTDITMIDDSCSPLTLTSGDTDHDSNLDVTETWVYNCSVTLPATHTNTVVATGWANGISATDIANATVVVGAPIIPPLIHVTKVPSPLVLPVGGGFITYTEKITNPGTVALSNVKLVDDKCTPMKYISGDTNANSKLDVTETWIYTCRTNLTQTTLNTATAEGSANGLTARDFAVATVVVPVGVPKLPATGVAPDGGNGMLYAGIAAGILMLLSVPFTFIFKKRGN